MGEEGGHHRACDLTFNTYPGSPHARPADAYTHLADTNTYAGTANVHAHTIALPANRLTERVERGERIRKVTLIALLVGVALLAGGCVRLAQPLDISQERLDAAAPPIQGPHTVGQTFVARHPNLSAIELLLVVHDGSGRATDGPRLTFHLRQSPQSQEDIVSLDINAGRLRHNDPLRLSFAPLPDSEGRTYYFFLEGSEDSRIGVWYNSLDAYGQGTMYLDGRPAEGDLRFITYYDYDLGLLARDVRRGLAEGWWLALPLTALLILPGYLLLSFLLPESNPDPVGRLALAFGLSLALVPLVILLSLIHI